MKGAEDEDIGLLTRFCRDDEGALMIEFDPAPSWEAFEGTALDLARRIGAQVGERIDAPQARLWLLHAGTESLTFLHAGERGTFLIAYEASAEPLLRQARSLLEAIARRVQSDEPQ